jgi:hypothetical protein
MLNSSKDTVDKLIAALDAGLDSLLERKKILAS